MVKPRQRGEYLKKGCKECKRRKIKCDEFVDPPADAVARMNSQGRALCWQCTRLGKECIYPRKGERVPRVSRKAMMQQTDSHSPPESTYEPMDLSRTLSVTSSIPSSGGPQQPETPREYQSVSYDRFHVSMVHPATANIPRRVSVHLMTPSVAANNIYPSPAMPMPMTQRATAHVAALVRTSLRQDIKSATAPMPLAHSPVMSLNMSHAAPSAGFAAGRAALTSRMRVPLVYGSTVVLPMAQPHLSLLIENDSAPLSYSTSEEPYRDIRGSTSTTSLEGQYNAALSHYNQGDLTGLAEDLNNLVTGMTQDTSLLHQPGLAPEPPTPITHNFLGLDDPRRHGPMFTSPRHVPIDTVRVSNLKEELFLLQFYLEFANVILPFHLYDLEVQACFNPARDILLGCAQSEPFLVAAILSQGARSCFSHSALAEYEEAHFLYLLKCLKLLGPALAEASSKDGLSLSHNIEAVLLTVLLLASSNAANPKQNWRPHLKGAKDLLIKYTANQDIIKRSKVLVFCKYWFILFEILAGLGLRLGGTVKLERELDMLLNCEDPDELHILAEIGVLQPNGFNLLCGYDNNCILVFRDMIKILNKSRDDAKYARSETLEYLRVLAALHSHLQCVFVDRQGLFHPDRATLPKLEPGLLLDVLPGNSDKAVISWMDTSHQTYILAATITMLTEFFGFSASSPHVQQLTVQLTMLLECATLASRILEMKHVIMMMQWPALVAGLNSVRSVDRAIVGDLLRFAARVGAGSANHTLARLEWYWIHGGKGEVEVENHVDVVNY